ncbi:MAG: HD domain-containing phosphohydrolase [Lachnospiraceae bacterium]|nr:HD domain-containing phosphohydrolase [Lachnospiraceae bacterium]
MGKIVDYNLTEELEHGVYVSCLVRDLCRELDIREEEAYNMRLAGLVHDIGKLRLANYIYGRQKITSPLVIEEMKYVRMHSMLSYEILKGQGFPADVQEMVRCHHENYDGSGYPDNLMGEEIPLGARIIRVCDVFAALTADRPYRKRFSALEAMSLMIDEINHFDMGIFLAFQNVVHSVGSSYQVHFPENDSNSLLKELLKEN